MELVFESFLLNITPETYTFEWIANFLNELMALKQNLMS